LPGGRLGSYFNHFHSCTPSPAPGGAGSPVQADRFSARSWSRLRAADWKNPVIDLRFLPEQAGSGGALGTFPAIALFIARTLSAS
jgi:hypothetical protein